ncbi:MAG: hypothetical protein R3182_07265, partial [Draconibacterium sp.]|nr:hypothetical protein [Draconibacterium sp.]
MKKITLILLAVVFISAGALAQSYDSVSGATQKEDAKNMNMEHFKKALQQKDKKLVFSTVNEDGTPNAAVYGS